MTKKIIFGLFAILILGLVPAFSQTTNSIVQDLPDGLYAVIDTSIGNIVIELYYEQTPITVQNFVGLAEGSLGNRGNYFDGIKFHRVEPGFVIQGGDPTGTGRGGPGYQFPDEIVSSLNFNSEGVVGMANAGPNTNGSQFFITLAPASFLNGSYTVFGKVKKGIEVVQSIRVGDKMRKVTIVRKGKNLSSYKATKESFEKALSDKQKKQKLEAQSFIDKQIKTIETNIDGLGTSKAGLRYKILKKGNGEIPANGKTVKLLYSLSLYDGQIIDSSAMHNNEALSFALGSKNIIAGFNIAVSEMTYGEKRIVIIPPEYGYGERGIANVIPSNAVLIFEIELLK